MNETIGKCTVARTTIGDKVTRATPSGAVRSALKRGSCLFVLAVGGLAGTRPTLGAQIVPPDEEWRTLETEHFRVTFPRSLERLGREAAARAERAHERLAALFVDPPAGRTEILLSDHVDRSNGSARAAPYRRIVLFARPPIDGLALSHFDDWMEVVLIHELAHVFHFDAAGPLGGVLRKVFGRVPVTWPFFPEQGTPGWVVEGLATWYESELTESGRVKGAQHEMVLRTAALENRLESLDQASGDSPVWPAGRRPYVYGSLFFDYLVERYGIERIGAFVDAVGNQLVPYRLDAAARASFGVSFEEAWRAWANEVEEGASRTLAGTSRRAPLTDFERITAGARTARFARATQDGSVVYAVSDGREDTELRRWRSDGETRSLTRTNGLAPFDVLGGGRIVLSQLEAIDPYRTFSDLYVLRPGGDVTRVTRGARLEQPAAVPGADEVVAVQGGDGSSSLVAVDLRTGRVTRHVVPEDPRVHWAFPEVSPDGRWVAAARWTEGAFFDVVVVARERGSDAGAARVVEVTADRAMDTAPAWSPDGRWLLWASERTGILNVFAASFDREAGRVGPVQQVTNTVTGAHYPSVSPDGRWLYVSRYHAEGWEIERTPFDPSTFFDPLPLDPRFGRPENGVPSAATIEPLGGVEERDYSPFPTLFPRFWQPTFLPSIRSRGFDVIGPSFGFLTRGEDLVGRHAVDAAVLASTSDARVSGNVGYRWAGLGNPTFGVGASQFWDAAGPFAQEVGGAERRFFVDERERSVSAAVTLQRARVRNRSSLSLSGGVVWERLSVLEEDLSRSEDLVLEDPDSRLTDVRVTASLSTVRSHAFSISAEEGVGVLVRGRSRSELDLSDAEAGVEGMDRSVDDVIGRLLLFESFAGPGFADHVLALRASGGVARGPGADAFHFDVGGASGTVEPVTGFGLFGGRSFFFPARGFESGQRGGRYAWSASLEYRFPLAMANRGFGLVPLHVDWLAGSLFVDAGNAWGPDLGLGSRRFDNPRDDPLASVGVELVSDVLTFFSIPVTLRSGVAVPVSGADGASVYFRFGRPF